MPSRTALRSFAVAAALALPASAEVGSVSCAAEDRVRAVLRDEFQEEQAFVADVPGGQRIVLMLSPMDGRRPEARTFSILLLIDGAACMLASGGNWSIGGAPKPGTVN